MDYREQLRRKGFDDEQIQEFDEAIQQTAEMLGDFTSKVIEAITEIIRWLVDEILKPVNKALSDLARIVEEMQHERKPLPRPPRTLGQPRLAFFTSRRGVHRCRNNC